MKVLSFLIVALCLSSCSSGKMEIHQWRGEDRNGIYPGEGLLEEWPEGGPAELWTVDGLGNGYGSPVFTGEYFYIAGETDSISSLLCFDLAGSKQWQVALGHEWITSFPGSRSAPTILGDLIYVGTGMGGPVLCRPG